MSPFSIVPSPTLPALPPGAAASDCGATTQLVDPFGRQLTYLRVSVTDRCNLRCVYCLPETMEFGGRDFLSGDEIVAIVGALVDLGIRRVRLTGGEPLVRRDLVDLVAALRALPLDDLSLSTNGTELARLAAPLRAAGLDRVNVSLDSLDPETFRAITRSGDLAQVWAGIDAALAAGLAPVKLNTVLLAEQNLVDVDRLADLTLTRPFEVRFIELMETAANRGLAGREFLSCDAARERIEHRHGPLEPLPDSRRRTGPAKRWRIPGAAGAIGFITPLSHTFCGDCNRLRLTARGELRLCLFAERTYPLRPFAGDAPALRHEILRVVREKPAEHLLTQGNYGNLVSFMQIGG